MVPLKIFFFISSEYDRMYTKSYQCLAVKTVSERPQFKCKQPQLKEEENNSRNITINNK